MATGKGKRSNQVASTLVHFIKSKQRRAKRKKVAASARQTATANPIEVVRRVKDLARDLGGIRNLKMLVDLLAD